MLTALLNGQTVIAKYCERGEDYKCPHCGQPLTLRRGSVRIAHFAHKKGSVCPYSTETEAHMQTKMDVYTYFKERGCPTFLEDRRYPDVRPDVMVIFNGYKFAFEIQHSNLSLDMIAFRTKKYLNRNIPVCWMLDKDRTKEILSSDTFRLKAQERYFKGMAFGILVGMVDGKFVAFKTYDVVGSKDKILKTEKHVSGYSFIDPIKDMKAKKMDGGRFGLTSYPDRFIACVNYDIGMSLPVGVHYKSA